MYLPWSELAASGWRPLPGNSRKCPSCRFTTQGLKECSCMSMVTKKPLKDGHDAEEPRYEKRDANIPALLQFGFWLAIVIAVAVIGMKFTLNYFQKAIDR